jgi:BatD DUF11 like domain
MDEPSLLPDRRKLRARRFADPWFCAVAALWFCLAASLHAAVTLTVSLDRNIITLGEGAILSLKFENGQPTDTPVLPAIPNLHYTSPPGYSSHIGMDFGSGTTTSSFIYTFTVIPAQPGEYTIPALTAQVGNQTITSLPVKLTVLKPGAAVPVQNPGDQPAFTKLLVPKQKVYVGEVIRAQFQLYLRDGVLNLDHFQMTSIQADGFTVGKMQQEAVTTTRLGNVGYNILPVTMLFTPAKAGTLNLGPLACGVDLFFGPPDIFGRPTRRQHFNLTNEVVAIESMPLPSENVPPGFNGAIGNFTLTETASPTNIAAGDPVTVTVQISGQGALDAVTLPAQTGWDHFKLYPPTSDFQPADELAASGTKVFKLTAVPEGTDVRELPPFSFSFFDPDAKSYRTLTRPAVPLLVRPSAASLPPPVLAGATASDNPPAPQDIAPLKPRLGMVAQIRPPLATQPWFIAAQGVPVAAWLTLLLQRRQKERLAANPRLRRQRQVEQTLRAGWRELREAAAANQPEKFFAALFHQLQEQLGERLDLPASAITEAIVEERLRPLGVPDATLADLTELFQACNHARYARETTGETLASLIPRAESVVRELKNLKA